MPQVLKDEVRAAIAQAALGAFAREGFAGARMPEIAAGAGISTGNIYRYFKSKDELFYAVVDVRFAAAFLRLLRRRVQALRASPDLASLDARAQEAVDELLSVELLAPGEFVEFASPHGSSWGETLVDRGFRVGRGPAGVEEQPFPV
jgi:AcrR family transcriptional regulator